MTYDKLRNEYAKEVTILEHPIKSECEKLGIHGVKGLYKNNCIAIDNHLTNIEKKCTLAEELGHHYTSAGNILDMRLANSRKQERIAREWGARKLVQYNDFIRACNIYDNIYQIAEELNVTYDVVESYYNYLYRTYALNS